MARTITEIKESIVADFMRNADVAQAYGFTVGDNFSSQFSRASIESVLFYIFACAAWTMEQLFDTYRQEVNAQIDAIIPHRPKWYRDKVLAFMQGKSLIPDTDRYNTDGMSDDQIATAQVVKHAVANESRDASLLTIKVAGDKGGKRSPLDDATAAQLTAYLAEIKDAGVRTALVNIAPDRFDCQLDIYYDPLLLAAHVESACREAIRSYIENLPFNGEYTNMSLIDRLQRIEGVKIPEFRGAQTTAADERMALAINARCIPAAGYFEMGNVQLTMKAYNEQI